MSHNNLPGITDDGAWCWFQNPRAIRYDGHTDRTYLGWVSRAGDIDVGAVDHETQSITHATLEPSFEEDDHDAPGLCFDQKDHLIAFYTAHGGPEIRYRRSQEPESIAEFGPVQTVSPSTNHTYANPRWLDGDLYVFYRNGSGNLTAIRSADGGESWSQEQAIITTGGRHWCVYFQLSEVGHGGIEIAMTFAYGGGHHPHRDIRHVRFDGDRITAADGTVLANTPPLEFDATPLVFDSAATGNDAWVWDCAVGDGQPAIAFAEIRSETDHAYRYARWTDTGWRSQQLIDAGSNIVAGEVETYYSGGVYLDHEEPTIAYAAVGDNTGSSIQRIDVETDGSPTELIDDSVQNVRPVVPRNRHPELPVVWMHGRYDHYANQAYGTAIRSTDG